MCVLAGWQKQVSQPTLPCSVCRAGASQTSRALSSPHQPPALAIPGVRSVPFQRWEKQRYRVNGLENISSKVVVFLNHCRSLNSISWTKQLTCKSLMCVCTDIGVVSGSERCAGKQPLNLSDCKRQRWIDLLSSFITFLV